MSTSLRSPFPASVRPARRASSAPARRSDPFRAGLRWAYALSGATLLGLFVLGSSFYLTTVAERAHHDGYWEWKAGGRVGHALGTAGAIMMLLLLLYSVRKRIKAFRGLGPVGRWLDVHIYLGVFGPLLITLHSAFKVQGLVALAFWSMIAVVLSGLVGRYLYVQIPRTRAGEELELAEVVEEHRRVGERLCRDFGCDETRLGMLERLAAPPEAEEGLRSALGGLLLQGPRRRRAVRSALHGWHGVPLQARGEIERVLARKAALAQRVQLWRRVHALFHYWHVLHKPLALVMYLFMALHVAVALLTGYGWAGGD